MALLDLLKFVTAGPWGSGKDAPLTAAEHDGNTKNLADAIQDLIDNPVAGVSVSNISVVGRQVTFYMTDASTEGPFDLPVAQPRYRGEWEASASYSAFDIVTVTGTGVFMVLQDHISESTFADDAGDSDGDYYVQIGAEGGGGGGGGAGGFTYSAGGPVTVSEDMAGTLVVCSGGADITLPVTFIDTAEVRFFQDSASPLTFAAESGIALKYKSGFDPATSVEGDVINAKYSEGDAWYLWGDLTPST